MRPAGVSESGYRLYDGDSLTRLQQILFFRELGFSLNEIKELMSNPNYDMQGALAAQKQLLTLKRDRIERMIALVESKIGGEDIMSFDQFKTDEIDRAKERYAVEAKRRWGETAAYREYANTRKNDDSANEANAGLEKLMRRFALIRRLPANGTEAQGLVVEWQNHITKHFYACTNDILGCLGQMYIADERFKANIDRYGDGTAAFMARAIAFYCNAN